MTNKTLLKTQELLEEAVVIDGHSDILIPVTEVKMEISEDVVIPKLEEWTPTSHSENHPFIKFGFNPHTVEFGCMGQYDIPKWRKGGINTQVCAIYLDDSKLDDPFVHGMKMAMRFKKVTSENPDLLKCLTVEDIYKAKRQNKIGWVLSFEGCEALGGDLNQLEKYYQFGLRIASLTHTRSNLYADGCWSEKDGGLTSTGKELIRKLEQLKVVIDLVHIGKTGFWDIMEMSTSPMILSHSTSTMFASTRTTDRDFLNGKVPRPRLEIPRDKEMLEAMVKNNGVLGMIWILYKDLHEAVDDFETALEVMGPNHIGLGSDLYGQEMATPGLEDISRLPNLVAEMVNRGHSDETILKFLGKNYLRVFKKVWGN